MHPFDLSSPELTNLIWSLFGQDYLLELPPKVPHPYAGTSPVSWPIHLLSLSLELTHPLSLSPGLTIHVNSLEFTQAIHLISFLSWPIHSLRGVQKTRTASPSWAINIQTTSPIFLSFRQAPLVKPTCGVKSNPSFSLWFVQRLLTESFYWQSLICPRV